MKWNEHALESLLASASFDGSVKIWRLEPEARELVGLFEKAGPASQNGLDWAPSPAPLLGAVSSAGEVLLVLLRDGLWNCYGKAVAPAAILTAICWAPAGSQHALAQGLPRHYFAYTGCSQTLSVEYFDLAEERIVPVYAVRECHAHWVRDLSWSAASTGEAQLLATASEDKSCKVWRLDLARGRAASQAIALNSPAWRVSWNFIGNLLAVALTSLEGANLVQIYREGDGGQWELHSQLP